ncbi:VacJ family lipoprotein [Billgrantia pellis]|uniref:VacJ family lipoprotein n=1 Tax=Billgrantia pellis TaxID=2606936 RepID=A0A7V7G1R1_9GAMM|nr:VacJ family lipoprotein [Halomonas pellis]KAA0011364.1 VacJ family lipoprotein [Halomonas pellis]
MVVKQTGFLFRALVALAAVAMLAGCAGRVAVEDRHPDDPWEGFNRRVFSFNEAIDRAVLKPVARGYRTVTPEPVQTGIGNFFSNLGEIRTALNSLLQGKPANAGLSTSRFLINTTVGIGGLWDFATPMGITAEEEDFGQTLGAWGVGEGPYLVLPFLGPSTVRDTSGLPLDMYTYPLTYVEDDKVRIGLTALRVVDIRAGLLDQEELIRGDRYVFIRDAYLQRRRFEVSDGELGDDPFASDDFEFDDSDFDDADFDDSALDEAGSAD